MYVNVRLTIGMAQHAFLVSQAALQRDATGPYVLVAGPDDKVIQKRVVTQALSGFNWIVTEGLANGDRIIVAGIQSARPGTRVIVASEPAAAAQSGTAPGADGAPAASP
jgi:membrane fusion protein (multidrug efflux system)